MTFLYELMLVKKEIMKEIFIYRINIIWVKNVNEK